MPPQLPQSCVLNGEEEQLLEPMDELLHACSLSSFKEEESQRWDSTEENNATCTQDPAEHINLLREQFLALRTACVSHGAEALGLQESKISRNVQNVALGCIEAFVEDAVNEQSSHYTCGYHSRDVDKLIESYIATRDIVPMNEKADMSQGEQSKGKTSKKQHATANSRTNSKEREKLEQRKCIISPSAIAKLIENAECVDEGGNDSVLTFAMQQVFRLSKDLQHDSPPDLNGADMASLAGLLLRLCMSEVISKRFLLHTSASKSTTTGVRSVVENDNWLLAGLAATRVMLEWLCSVNGRAKAASALRFAAKQYIQVSDADVEEETIRGAFEWIRKQGLDNLMHRWEASFESYQLSLLLRSIFEMMSVEAKECSAPTIEEMLHHSDSQSPQTTCILLRMALEAKPPDDDLKLAEIAASAVAEVSEAQDAEDERCTQEHASVLNIVTHGARAEIAKAILTYLDQCAAEMHWALQLPGKQVSSCIPGVHARLHIVCSVTKKLIDIGDGELEASIAPVLFKFASKCYQIVQLAAKQLVAPRGLQQSQPPDGLRQYA